MKKKTADLFKIAARPGLGLIGGMDPATKQRLMGSLQNAVIPAAATAIPAALLAGATADKGEGVGDALKAGLVAGGGMLAANTGHSMLMGGKSPLAHSYQRGIGSDFRNIANQGRELAGMDPMKMPRPPAAKTASADQFKIANPHHGGYAMPPEAQYYGQYGQDPEDKGLSGVDKAIMLGGGTLLAGGLHHTLMNSRGDLPRSYQTGIGGSIRDAANSARTSFGMDPVAQPDHPLIAGAKDKVQGAVNAAQKVYANGKAVVPAVMGAIGTAGAIKAKHNDLMADETNFGDMYRRIGTPLENAGRTVASAGQRAAGWVADKTAPKPKAVVTPEAKARAQPKINKAEPVTQPPNSTYHGPRIKKSSLIYQAGADEALAQYLR